MNRHHYSTRLNWTGNTGTGTAAYRSYERSYTVSVPGKPELYGSSDPSFKGDEKKHNPEEMFVAALSACHMLWYLHLCAEAGIIVQDYKDEAEGIMQEDADRGGFFTEVILRPEVVIADESKREQAMALHERANKMCFIANSCNFPVRHEPEVHIRERQ